jgi:hypothetical protein
MDIEKQKFLKTTYPTLFNLLPNLLFKGKDALYTFDDLLEQSQSMPIGFGIECGDGWFDLINEACAKIEELNRQHGYNIQVHQIKEKYGTLRFYVNNYTDGVDAIISEAEEKSETTCEICGKPGKLYTDGWCVTVCDEHHR